MFLHEQRLDDVFRRRTTLLNFEFAMTTGAEYQAIYNRLQTYLTTDNFGAPKFDTEEKKFYLDTIKPILDSGNVLTSTVDTSKLDFIVIVKKDEDLWQKVLKVKAKIPAPVLFNHILLAFLKSLPTSSTEKQTIQKMFTKTGDEAKVQNFLGASTQPVGN